MLKSGGTSSCLKEMEKGLSSEFRGLLPSITNATPVTQASSTRDAECCCAAGRISKKLARHESCSSSVQAAQLQKSILAEPVGLEQRLD